MARIFDRLRRIFGSSERRSLDAAGGGRRWSSAATIASLNTDILLHGTLARRRAAYYARNNAYAAAAVGAHKANIVGTGIKPRSRHPDEGARRALHSQFDAFADDADADGLTDLYGLQALAVGHMVESGEAFLRFRVMPGLAVPLQLQVIDAEQVPMDLTRELPGGARIVAGVEFDAAGRRVAYHVYPNRPGELSPVTLTPIRVPASEIIHLFVPLSAGQVRGLSWFASVLLRLHEIDQLQDAQLVKQKIAAMLAGFIIDGEGNAAGYQAGATSSVAEASLEPGTMRVLAPGSDVKFSSPPDAGSSYQPFMTAELHAVAAGVGATYEQVTGDMREANYSSARVALIEYRRKIEMVQHHVVVPQMCRPIWRRFIDTAALSGALKLASFADLAPFYAVDWYPPGWPWVDPLKDVQAEVAAINAGLKSRTQALAERGYDAETVDAEIAADQERARRLGLQLGVVASAPQAQEPNDK